MIITLLLCAAGVSWMLYTILSIGLILRNTVDIETRLNRLEEMIRMKR